MSSLTYRKEQAIQKIQKMGKFEFIQIFNILKDKLNFTENKNGFLFDLQKLHKKDLEKLEEFISNVIENNEKEREYEKEIELAKKRIGII